MKLKLLGTRTEEWVKPKTVTYELCGKRDFCFEYVVCAQRIFHLPRKQLRHAK